MKYLFAVLDNDTGLVDFHEVPVGEFWTFYEGLRSDQARFDSEVLRPHEADRQKARLTEGLRADWEKRQGAS